MAFLHGTITVRRANNPGPQIQLSDENLVERIRRRAGQPYEKILPDQAAGWVSSHHILDTDLAPEKVLEGDFLYMDLRVTAKKVPPALLRAHCYMEEMAERQASGREFLKREEKKQIKEEVQERLLGMVPPSLRSYPVVYSTLENCWWTAITSDLVGDLFMELVHSSLESRIEWIGPEELALAAIGPDGLRDLRPVSFALNNTAGQPEGDALADLGPDFLTWLWYRTEIEGPAFELGELGTVEVLIEDDLSLEGEQGVARRSSVKSGLPTHSAEAKAALSVGKKLCRCRWGVTQGDDVWMGQFDARGFVTRGLKIPSGTAYQEGGVLESRMGLVERYWALKSALFEQFLKERTGQWAATVEDMKKWIAAKDEK